MNSFVFRLFLTTANAVNTVPAEVVSLTNLVVFRPEREGLKGLLLDQALKLHNAKSFEERQQLKKARHMKGGDREERGRGGRRKGQEEGEGREGEGNKAGWEERNNTGCRVKGRDREGKYIYQHPSLGGPHPST